MYTFTCELCGTEFQTKRKARRKICHNQHYLTCQVCGNKYPVSREDLLSGNYRNTCSENCRYKLSSESIHQTYVEDGEKIINKRRKTCLDRYGVENNSQSDEFKAKFKTTMLRRYGVEHALQSSKFKRKAEDTCIKRYGVSNAWNRPDVRQRMMNSVCELDENGQYRRKKDVSDKISKTCLEKYGSVNPFSSDIVRKKCQNTFQERYGSDSYMQSDRFLDVSKSRMKELYGVEHALQNDNSREKFRATMKSRYGREYASQIHIDDEHFEIWNRFKENSEEVISEYFGNDQKPTFNQLSILLGVSENIISYTLSRCGKLHLIQYAKSNVENEVHTFIDSVCPDVSVIRGTKSIIKPYELDIYLPEFNFAVEVNPTATHNSSFGFMKFNGNKPLPASYHKMKTDMCEDKNVQLLHIFGYDWSHRSDIIKSMIRANLNSYDTCIYARQCSIEEVDSKTARLFLNINHLQGNANSSYRYGLFFNGQLVSLMCFCKPRKTMGYKVSRSNESTYELVRFCNKLNTQVVGSASRLFSRFLKDVSCKYIVSYSDRAHFSGILYSVLGFERNHDINPGYVWVRQNDDVPFHRINTQKRNLKKFLNDPCIDLSLTEKQIMEEHGYVQVYDSGKVAWIYER